MRINHIVGRHLRHTKRTTIADRTAPPAPDLVMRDFTANTLNARGCGDITCVGEARAVRDVMPVSVLGLGKGPWSAGWVDGHLRG